MSNGIVSLVNIESITESVVEEAASEFIVRVMDMLFSNLGTILLIAVILLCIIFLFTAGARRKGERELQKELNQLFKEKDLELDRLMLSDVFKELDSGFIQGNTSDILKKLEQRLLASHQYSEQLQRKLDSQKVSLFSMVGSASDSSGLQDEVYRFAEQVDQYAHELMGMTAIARQTAGLVQPVQQQYSEVQQLVQRIADQYGYPLNELKKQLDDVEGIVNRAVQSASFDAVRAQKDVSEARQAMITLQERAAKLEQDIELFNQMKQRIQERVEKLREQASNNEDSAQNIALEERISKVEIKFNKLSNSLQLGTDVDLRAAAIEIEQMMSGQQYY